MQRFSTQNDSVSVDFVPDQLLETSGVLSPCMHWLFGKDGGYVTCLKEDGMHDVQNNDMPSAKAEATVMREVADYLQSQECDEFWAPRTRTPRRVSCTYWRYAPGF